MHDAAIRPKLVVGLGNPGDKYDGTRHNIGFVVIDQLLTALRKVSEPSHTAESMVWEGQTAGTTVRLQKPLTFMNLSGNAVGKLSRRLKLMPEEVLLVYDDLDLPLGRIRLRTKGSSGGHRGVESVIQVLASASFPRLRIGIGQQQDGATIDHVLSPFTDAEQPVLEKTVDVSCDAILFALRHGVQAAMNQYNGIQVNNDDTNTIM